ncbi:hypothetical protein [Leptospira gomenensis]|uniref:hypothetical protein n=1 Tax=Leptospira gomenensis TaxID=2484974 RepID=UPI00143842FE|nr:hypothetical protein [Leptospira gomenensis]
MVLLVDFSDKLVRELTQKKITRPKRDHLRDKGGSVEASSKKRWSGKESAALEGATVGR